MKELHGGDINPCFGAAFETRRGPKLPRSIHLAFPVTIKTVTPATPGAVFDPATGLPSGARMILDEGEVTLYDDPQLTNPLYRFARQEGKPTAVAATAAGAPSDASDQLAVTNGAAAAAQWKLPTRLGLPLADAGNYNGSDVGLEGLFGPRSDPRIGHIEWTRAVVALSLSLAPDRAKQLSPTRVLALACLYLPPSRIATLGAGPYCAGNDVPISGDEFKVRDAWTTSSSNGSGAA